MYFPICVDLICLTDIQSERKLTIPLPQIIGNSKNGGSFHCLAEDRMWNEEERKLREQNWNFNCENLNLKDFSMHEK